MGERAPGQKWTAKDTLLALSLTHYEAGLCRGCGQPLALAHADDETTGHGFAVEEYVCTSCYELEDVSEDRKKQDSPGTKRYTVVDD